MTEQPIAVCVDGSESSVPALTWAAGEARRRHVPLTIAHVAGHHRFARFPGVPVECRLAQRSAGTALTSASRQAQLIVVGRHGPNMLASSLTGSPVPELLRRSGCPVFLARR